MLQEVETVLLTDHLNTDFTKPSRVVFVVVVVVAVVSEFILHRNQRALLCVGKKDVLHFNKSINLGEVYIFIHRYHLFLSLENSTHLN